MKIALASLAALAASIAAAAAAAAGETPSGPWVLGLQLGEPLKAKPCSTYTDWRPAKGFCLKEGRPPAAGAARLRFAFNEMPAWAGSDEATIEILQGRVERIWLITRGAVHQQDAFDDMVRKFGSPVSKEIVPMQNGFGAKVDVLEAQWTAGPYRVDFKGVVSGTGNGSLTVTTPSAQEAVLDRFRKSTGGRKGL